MITSILKSDRIGDSDDTHFSASQPLGSESRTISKHANRGARGSMCFSDAILRVVVSLGHAAILGHG